MAHLETTERRHTDPMRPDEMKLEEVYYSVAYAANSLEIPLIDTLVLVAIENDGDETEFVFQYALDYFSGNRAFGSEPCDEVELLLVEASKLDPVIYGYEGMLEQLRECGVRRSQLGC